MADSIKTGFTIKNPVTDSNSEDQFSLLERTDEDLFAMFICICYRAYCIENILEIEHQWLEHLWNHENMLETGVVRAREC